MHDEVVTGQGRPLLRSETTDGGVDDPAVLLVDRVIIQAEALETTGLEIFDEDIGAGSEFVGQMQVRGIVKIEDDRALVAVDGQVVGGHPMAVWWHPAPGVIPGGAFNLDHRCTQITQQHGAVRTGEYSREVGDQQAIERPGSLVGFLPGFLVVLLWHKVYASSGSEWSSRAYTGPVGCGYCSRTSVFVRSTDSRP